MKGKKEEKNKREEKERGERLGKKAQAYLFRVVHRVMLLAIPRGRKSPRGRLACMQAPTSIARY